MPATGLFRLRDSLPFFSRVDGWRVEAVSINESSPVEPGSSASCRVTATNVDDQDERVTIPILVNGSQQGSATLTAAVTGIGSDTFTVTVPSGVSSMRVCVGGECDSISVGVTNGDGDDGDGGDGGTTFDPSAVTITNCDMSPTSVQFGQDVTFEATVNNDNDLDAAFDVVWIFDIAEFSVKDVRVPSFRSKTFTAAFVIESPISAGSHQVDASLKNVRGV